jgi:hypothetical protein
MPCDYVGVALSDVASQQLRLYAVDFPAGQRFLQEDMRLPIEGSAFGQVCQTGKPLALSGPQGVAARLGLKRTTLLSRMARLGIARRPS